MRATNRWYRESGHGFLAKEGKVGFAHLKDYTAEYCEWGTGQGRPIVLVPGLAGGYDLLGPLAEALSSHFRVISYQYRGEDNCFALRRPFDLDDLVEDLRSFLDYMYLENPVVLGVSFGGIVALELAARHPNRISHLVVQGTGVRFEKSLLQVIAGAVLSRYPLPCDNPFINQFFNLLFGRPQKQDARFEFVTRQCWQTDQSVMSHRFRLAEKFDIQGKLDRIRVPTLILSGDRDVLVSGKSLKNLREGLALGRFQYLRGCGHLAFVTEPDLMSGKVRRFLAA